MAYQALGLGSTANDGTGDDLRTGGDKINDNFEKAKKYCEPLIYRILGC